MDVIVCGVFCSQNKMFYTDFVANHIYSASLDTGGDVELLLNDSVEVPGEMRKKEGERERALSKLLYGSKAR